MSLSVSHAAALALAAALLLGGCAQPSPAGPAASPSGSVQAPASPSENVSPSPAAETLRFIDAWGEWHTAQLDPGVARHDYDWSYLDHDGPVPTYEGDSRYQVCRGVDVSVFQGDIDWDKVKADGYDFAFVRLAFRGYGQSGVLKLDDNARRNIQNARAAGLDVGAYVFSQAVNEAEALEEAEFAIENLEGLELTLPLVFDPELIRDAPARTDDVTGEQFTRNAQVFCQRVQEAGYEPMIYSNMIWESFLFDLKALADYPIWYADYEPVPQTPYRFTFWQCACDGQVDGIQGNTDIDLWFRATEK